MSVHSFDHRTGSTMMSAVGSAVVLLMIFQGIGASATGSSSCWVVRDTSPFRTCREETHPEVCNRGYGVYLSEKLCCTPGAAFPDGCSSPPKDCWVVENQNLRTCVKDQRKCLQGQGVYPSEELCCTPGIAFPEGCGKPPLSTRPCWVADTYFPVRTCKETRRLCSPPAGVNVYPNKEACCVRGGAFSDGCSTVLPPAPCYVVDTYDPIRKCRREDSLAACYRGWGVYASEELCCTPGLGFPEGCTNKPTAQAG